MKFLCPNCREPFDLTDEEFPRYAGKKARCPSCRAVMEIPETPPVRKPVPVASAVVVADSLPAPAATTNTKSCWVGHERRPTSWVAISLYGVVIAYWMMGTARPAFEVLSLVVDVWYYDYHDPMGRSATVPTADKAA
jgi:hypothetical protein